MAHFWTKRGFLKNVFEELSEWKNAIYIHGLKWNILPVKDKRTECKSPPRMIKLSNC